MSAWLVALPVFAVAVLVTLVRLRRHPTESLRYLPFLNMLVVAAALALLLVALMTGPSSAQSASAGTLTAAGSAWAAFLEQPLRLARRRSGRRSQSRIRARLRSPPLANGRSSSGASSSSSGWQRGSRSTGSLSP